MKNFRSGVSGVTEYIYVLLKEIIFILKITVCYSTASLLWRIKLFITANKYASALCFYLYSNF